MTSIINLGPHSSFILASWTFGLGVIAVLIMRAWLLERITQSRLKMIENKKPKLSWQQRSQQQ